MIKISRQKPIKIHEIKPNVVVLIKRVFLKEKSVQESKAKRQTTKKQI